MTKPPRVYRQSAPGLGPSLREVLEEEGIYEEVEAATQQRVEAWQKEIAQKPIAQKAKPKFRTARNAEHRTHAKK